MIKNKQLVVDNKKGDCFRACWTSILEIPNDQKLPNLGQKDWYWELDKLLRGWGIKMAVEHKAMWRDGYWIASVPSKNYKDVSHAIVMNGGRVAFDPSTRKRYRTGRNLLGSSLVTQCQFFEVVDPSLLHNYVTYQKKHANTN